MQAHYLLVLAFLAGAGCRATSIPLWYVPEPVPADSLEVMKVRSVAYYAAPDADTFRHKLDLFVPKSTKDFPVVVLVHGGAWIMGDNRCCGLYSSVGEFLASRGIGAVLPNYRLSPGVRHPEHTKDVARAVAWTKKNIAQYGGRPDQIILVGHSAGGHLVSLLATHEKHLQDEGLQTADLRGVIGVSGVYSIPAGEIQGSLGGAGPSAMHWNTMFPIRGQDAERDKPAPKKLDVEGWPVRANLFGPVFGNDPKARAEASPLTHVRPGLPPFLLLYAENELPSLGEMAEQFHEALIDKRCPSKIQRIPGRNHNTILFRAVTPADPVARLILDFVRQTTDKK